MVRPEFEIVQDRLADELPQNGIVWHQVVFEGQKPFQESQQALGFDKF